MSNQNKKLPKTSQQISDEADRASSRAFAKQGLAPYDQDKEEPEVFSRSLVDELESVLPSNEDFLEDLKAGSIKKSLGTVAVDVELSADERKAS
jgi:hypothetical protein